MKYPLNLLVT